MNIKTLITDNGLEPLMLGGTFGIEKEGVRTDQENKLALSDHPKKFGDRSYHPYVQTDFSEAQLELVTPPANSLKETYKWYQALHDVVHRSMADDEYIWPFSMPSTLPEEKDIPIIRVSDQEEIEYRKQLAKRYGKKKQLISGIHFNFAVSNDLIKAIACLKEVKKSEVEIKNELHLKLAQNFLQYQWIITYLFGASPTAEDDFFSSTDRPNDYVRSLRNSSYGYHNSSDIKVGYDNLKEYISDIESLVNKGVLSEEREFYGKARLRGNEKHVRNMLETGITYVEFRSFDLNPFESLGLSIDQAKFIHLFFITLMCMDQIATKEQMDEGLKKNEQTAMEDPLSPSMFKEEGLSVLKEMRKTCETFSLNEDYVSAIEQAIEAFNSPEKTLAAKIIDLLNKGESFLKLGEKLGKQYKKEANEKPFLLRGFQNMEMSTQLLLFDAILRGINIDILDEWDQFLKLEHKGHVEYVKNGNMTAKDTYISHWIMENKTVTKKILKENGFVVPNGDEFQSIEEAVASYYRFKGQSFVVKPKSTNYGLGISVFKKAPTIEGFKEALEIAFEEDTSVLVEEYASGTEYRFFVLDGKVQAVLLRVPANVIGDGKHTIAELIDQKNEDPLRGTNHRAPLEKIQKGNIEKLMLKEQGYDFESIPEEGKKVYLRENSNISTGGDSIDFTDEMHESYKKIAAKMAEPIGVRITGVDLIIPDHKKPSTPSDPGYTCIEANFNPAMHMHAYVYKGKGRRLTQGVLDMLFPELKGS